jgi:membrane dipeptidase
MAQNGFLGRLSDLNPTPSELDPLLPRTEPAPEISGYGFQKTKNNVEIRYDEGAPTHDDAEDTRSTTSEATSTRTALNAIIGIFSIVLFFGFVIAYLSPGRPSNIDPPFEPVPRRTFEERGLKILEETPLIDGHDDLAIYLRFRYKNHLHNATFQKRFEHGGLELHLDLPRLRAGKVGGAFWSAFVPCPKNASYDFSDSIYAEAVSTTLSQIDVIRRLQYFYHNTFTPALTSPALAVERFHSTKSLISPISIEGLHQIPPSAPMSTLRLYHALGVHAATLTWNCHNPFADAALIPSNTTGETIPAPYFRGGLTPAGRLLIREMNRLGILIDLSHTSYWTQAAVLGNNTSAAPVIYSHSSAFALCPHPRNVHDDMLDLVKKTNGLVMINFSPDFISCLPPPNSSVLPEFYEKNNTLHQVARHVAYVGERIGYDHVGFGSDFDGIFLTPRGLEGVDKFPDLVVELLKMGVSDKDMGKVVGGNILRVWQDALNVAEKMQREGVREGEDEVKDWGQG